MEMSNIIEAIKLALAKILRVSQEPSNVEYIINETIGTGGKVFDLEALLSGVVPNVIQIYSSQNFTLEYTTKDGSVQKTWPRTLVAGTWQTWEDEGYRKIKITPAVAAAIDAYISGVDKGR